MWNYFQIDLFQHLILLNAQYLLLMTNTNLDVNNEIFHHIDFDHLITALFSQVG